MSLADEFRRRASHEARRYGGDEWVFVRELLQNSRDAGAGRVDIEVERSGGVDRFRCADDGCGMSFEHARRYLFTLYASSKAEEREAAGRFGIGFWSVLRFAPDEVTIRSAPAGGEAWQLRFSGDLSRIDHRRCVAGTGTRIELVRRARSGDPAAEVRRAVLRDARHLRRLDDPRAIVDVRVNSKRMTTGIALDPPSLELVGAGFEGRVALDHTPRVDLLAHGLRVRTAATLDELLTRPDERRRRRFSPPEGLVPRVILDSRRLQVLMARGDARTDRELARLVGAGRRGIRRLVREQLDREAGLGPLARAAMRVREMVSGRWARWVLGVLLALAVGIAAAGAWRSQRPFGGVGAPAVDVPSIPPDPVSVLRAGAADGYGGPAVTRLRFRVGAPALGYRPVEAEPMLAVFRVWSMDDRGRVVRGEPWGRPGPYLGPQCRDGCIELVLDTGGMDGALQLPVPTGHRVDPESVRLDGQPVDVRESDDGGAVIELGRPGGRTVAYRTGPAAEDAPDRAVEWPALPFEGARFADRLAPLSPERAARAARDWVRDRVVYDTSDETVELHAEAAGSGMPFAERCLAVGAGDCDVQNTLVAAMLHRAGFAARLAVGFVGRGGRAQPGLHAWVEYRGAEGGWEPVDASGPVLGQPVIGRTPEGHADGDPLVGGTPGRWWKSVPAARWPSIAVLLAVVGVAVAVVRGRRARVGEIHWRENPGLAGLLRGVLTRPDAYGDLPLLLSRPVVPLIDGGAVGLDRARELAGRGRLAVGDPSSRLARDAENAGCTVIDGSRAEGEAVAVVLGAPDLRRWDRIASGGVAHPLLDRLRDAAGAEGEEWVTVLHDAVDEVAVLDGPMAGRRRGRRVVAVSPSTELWREVSRLEGSAPAAATLLLGERVVRRCRADRRSGRHLLARLAAAALAEREGRDP